MAYTYDDFLAAARKTGTMGKLSSEDLAVAQRSPEYGISVSGLMRDAETARTPEQRLLATEAANQIRRNYGVTPPSAVNAGVQPTGTVPAAQESDTYTITPQVLGPTGDGAPYGGYWNNLPGNAQGNGFQYDYERDPRYAAYKKAYLREGDRATANALAQAAAASGGQVSSYAASAAQQAGNYYAGKLSDVIPELEESAYQRYIDDRNFRYQQGRDNVSDQRWQTQYDEDKRRYDQEFAYQQGRDDVSDQRWQQEYDEDQRRYDQEWEEDKWRYDTEWQKKYGKKPDRGDGTGNNVQNTGPAPSPRPTPTPAHTPDTDKPEEVPQEPDTGKRELSKDGETFMKNLPYASAGTSEETWKQIVRERLDRSGLSYEDKVEIGYRLGL